MLERSQLGQGSVFTLNRAHQFAVLSTLYDRELVTRVKVIGLRTPAGSTANTQQYFFHPFATVLNKFRQDATDLYIGNFVFMFSRELDH